MSFPWKPWRCFITTQPGPAISCNPDEVRLGCLATGTGNPSIKNAASPEFGGDGFFVGERGIEIRGRLASTFDGADKPMQAFDAAKRLGDAEPGGSQRRLNNRHGLAIPLERTWKQTPTLA